MRKNADVRDSQWYQIGVRYAEGTSRINELPPAPNFYLGVLSVITDNKGHYLWSVPGHSFWREFEKQVASGAIRPNLLNGLEPEEDLSQAKWEEVLASDPETRLLGLDVTVTRSAGLHKGVSLVRVHEESVPDIPDHIDPANVLFA
jgi:hypothetical protein